MKSAVLLIDKAVEVCGSAAELARRLNVDRAEVTKLRQGKRPLSPEMAAEIADIAGEDARQAVIDAVIERNEGTRKGPVLREILGKALAAGVAAMSIFSYSGDSISATRTIATKVDALYIVSTTLCAVLRWLLGSEAGRCFPASGGPFCRPLPIWATGALRALFLKHEQPAAVA